MNTAFEFHDSVLAEIKEEGGHCLLLFRPAYIHRSEGRPGVDVGEGFTQNLQNMVGDAKVNRRECQFPLEITNGSITLGDERVSNVVPIPLYEKKEVLLKMLPIWGSAEIEIEGRSIEIRTIDEAVFVESFPGVSKPK